MSSWKEMKAEDLEKNAVHMIGKEWMLLTAGDETKSNPMTVSWGALGVMWGKPSVTVYVRPQRYTKEFLDREGVFTLSVLKEDYRKALNVCGTVSGRDVEDKWAAAGLTPFMAEGVPAVEEAELVLVCRVKYADTIKEEAFLDKEAAERWYPDGDYHTMYIAEITNVLVKEAV